ncbi:RNI-like protein [Daedalea quercina L-15889]|uniref:RNI-like protein n=1 Tax=Daedalea quercina L-15889 TaxID=1314783 RepID=A0A165TC86_9APHY|nr:RNI-like protein [Daedalea quercina L-15889]
MSRAHDMHIDNGEPEPLFDFDSNESLKGLYHLEAAARMPQTSSARISDLADMLSVLKPVSSTADLEPLSPDDAMEDVYHTSSKGKGVSQPMQIYPRHALEDQRPDDQDEDLFSMSFGTAVSSDMHELVGSPASTSASPATASSSSPRSPLDVQQDIEKTEMSSVGKGKARDVPPTLPPLSFGTTELNYASSDWPTFSSSIPGPSSFSSSYGSVGDREPSPGTSASVAGPSSTPADNVLEAGPALSRIPSRRRSLSSLSAHSKRSISALSITKAKAKSPSGTKHPGNLARKLLGKQRDSPSGSPTSPARDVVSDLDESNSVDRLSCLAPWTYNVTPRTSPLVTPAVETELGFGEFDKSLPIYYYTSRPTDRTVLRTKGRSYSLPLPFPTTPLDLVPAAAVDIFEPIVKPTPNYFDEFLPVELKLRILVSVVDLHEAEHQKRVDNGAWTLRKATSSKNRWVGRDRGIRELFKLSRVSKAWLSLVFDGQLWVKLDLHAFPNLPASALQRLAKVAGTFVRELDLRGHSDLESSTLQEITSHLCTDFQPGGWISHTHLTSINLQGCSRLQTRALHHLLVRSSAVRELCLRGLAAVTNTTCSILGSYCRRITTLDLSHCPDVSGSGIYAFVSAALARDESLPLKELRLSGLKYVEDGVMEVLGKAAPDLEVLDLSYCRTLHNSSVEAFVSCSEDDQGSFEMVQLTSRQAGRNPTDSTRYWRRVTRLRHLNLTACIMLTDHACSHLAHAVPKLEMLELAGIGAELGDSGLVRLLETTPFIRKLDLEDATQITDDVLMTITPEPISDAPAPRIPHPPQPGHALEHLIISYATEVTDGAVWDLVENCTRLRVLEVDNTRISEATVKHFVRLSRERKAVDAQIVAVDCRGIGERCVRDLVPQTRPRVGWRSYDARRLGFVDARDEEGLAAGQDELDAHRVALKTFFSWQTVDAVRAAREKKRKSTRRGLNASSSSTEDSGPSNGRARWWSPSGRRSGGTSPSLSDLGQERDGCTIM